MTANTIMSQPPYTAEDAKLAPDTLINKSGVTGKIMPNPMESMSAVANTTLNAKARPRPD
jgi:hypothetical protein